MLTPRLGLESTKRLNVNPSVQVGELVVYFEIDSFIPKTGHFWELFSQPGSSEWFRGKDGHRVKSTRIHSQVSQGLIYPLGNFPEITGPFEARVEEIGREGATEELLAKSFADLLGVVKWEFTETAETLPSLGPPPAFIRMPAWHRIQDVERFMFSRKLRQKTWQITEKLDGATMTVYKIANDSRWAASLPALPANSPITMHDDKNRYGVCSRKEDLIHRPGNLYWQTAIGSGLLAKIRHFPRPNIAVQGELCGSSIGGNTMQYPEGEHEFLVFAIWDINKGTYVRPKEVEELCGQFGIQHVPVVAYCSLADFARDLDELLSKAEGKGKFGGVREGLVFRSTDMDAFKVISNSWLSLTGK
jgi:RNA ligase (TIGR02306 family)